MVRRNNEDRRLRDASFFFRVEDSPFPYDHSLRIAQNHIRQIKLPAHSLGAIGRINGKRSKAGAFFLNFIVEIAIFRQLAETKRSPVPAVKNEDSRAGGHQISQLLRNALGIR